MMGGGVEGVVMNHYRNIDRSTVQFDFIVGDDSTSVPEEEIRSLGGRLVRVPSYRNIAQFMAACGSAFREFQPNIVHSHINTLSALPLAMAKRERVRVRVAHSHSTAAPGELVKNTAKAILRPLAQSFPTHYAACSEHAARWLFGPRRVQEAGVFILRNAIDLPSYAFDPAVRTRVRASLGIGDPAFVVGHAGRLSQQKNQSFLLAAFRQVLVVRPDALLILAGDGDLRGQIEREVLSLGIERSVMMLGLRHDVNELYQAMDVFALPSKYEGLGMVAIEAQASGLSVVASDAVPKEAGVTELVKFMSLAKSPAEWAAELVLAESHSRRDRSRDVGDAGYEITQSSSNLNAWYRTLVS
jgi:glycosyltransferase involved in cell wall biosynthesis